MDIYLEGGNMLRRRRIRPRAFASVAAATLALTGTAIAGGGYAAAAAHSSGGSAPTATPIKHLVVIFQENVSFDHYFATYPVATNPVGEAAFHAAPGTPTVNGLSAGLLTNNPNLSNPQRLDPSQAVTSDQGHGYTQEQQAFDSGLMDKFVQATGGGASTVMDYYDGNTVTGLWNYAQHFSLSDNSYGTTFGPSTPGAINVTSGNTFGAICGPTSAVINTSPCPTGLPAAGPQEIEPQGPGTTYSDADPYYDVCSSIDDGATPAQTIAMGGLNVGDKLDAANVTWGWFQGGFASPGYVSGQPTTDDPSAVCTGTTTNLAGTAQDYSPHHEPFQYYASTANPTHLPPTSVSMIGRQDQANHQYDLRDFWAAADSGHLPAVSYLKAPKAQDGHPGYSDPLDEQTFLVNTINALEKLPTWKSTAVIINWDDSDGWYDHQEGPIVDQSQVKAIDALTGAGTCGPNTTKVYMGQEGRCGVGPRIPMLVISPFSKSNFVDNSFTTQTSVVKFIEENWLQNQNLPGGSADAWTGSLDNMFNFAHPTNRPLFLNPATGEPMHSGK